LAEKISAMDLIAVLPGHVPSAPTLRKGCPMIHEGRSRVQVDDSIFVGGEGADEVTGHAHGLGRSMTLQALVRSHEPRLCRLLLVQRVKHSAQLGIRRADVEHRRAGDVDDVDMVIEEYRSR